MGSNDCSWRDPQFGPSTCTENPDGNGFWCTCATEAATCDFESFENGCSCQCVTVGSGLFWQCEPDEEFSSPCPILPPAGSGSA